jgi:hypothetical protein
LSRKLKLIQDHEDESATGAIKRYVTFAAILMAVATLIIFVFSLISAGSTAVSIAAREHKQEIALATREAIATTRAQARVTRQAEATQRAIVAALTPTATPTPLPTVQTTLRVNSELHSGPGFKTPIVGKLVAGSPITLTHVTPGGSWYLLADGTWVVSSAIPGVYPQLPIDQTTSLQTQD